jgi:hypothetical protein
MPPGEDDGRHATLDGGDGLPRQVIEGELRRILGSSAFLASERLRGFLCFVVEEALAGRADRLQAHNGDTLRVLATALEELPRTDSRLGRGGPYIVARALGIKSAVVAA